jgi:hypothetical protein
MADASKLLESSYSHRAQGTERRRRVSTGSLSRLERCSRMPAIRYVTPTASLGAAAARWESSVSEQDGQTWPHPHRDATENATEGLRLKA